MSAVMPVDPQKERQYAEWKARITGAGLPSELQPFVQGMQQMGEQEQAQSQAIEARRQAETAPLQANVQQALGELDKEIQTPVEKKPIPENTAQHLDPKQLNEAASSWMALGALAGLLVRQPMTAALNNMTAAMQGVLQGDDEQFKSNFALWQKNFDAAMKVNNQMLAEKQKIIQDKSLSLSVKQEMLHLVDKKYDNEVAANQRYWKGQHDTYNALMKATEMAVAAKERTQAAAQAHLDRITAMNLAHQDRMMLTGGGAGAAGGANIQAEGSMAATGMPINQIVPGGRYNFQHQNAVKAEAIRQIKEATGMDDVQAGQEYANRQAGYAASKGSVAQLNKMLGATRQAVSQLDLNIDNAKKEMSKLGSTNLSPILNAIARGEQKWTGDPAYSSLFYYMYAVATESARILSGGQASIAQLHVQAADEAKQWANINMTPDSFDSVAEAMKNEAAQRIQTFESAIQMQRVGGKTGSPSTAKPAASGGGWSIRPK